MKRLDATLSGNADEAFAVQVADAGHGGATGTAPRCEVRLTRSSALLSAVTGNALDLLSPAEALRAQAFRSEAAREDFIAAHLLVRQVASALVDVPPHQVRIVQKCEECGGPHGRPVADGHPGLHLSMSHGSGWVAASAGCGKNAIDIERWTAFEDPALISGNVFSPAELHFLLALPIGGDGTPQRRSVAATRIWTRKECLIKLGLLSLDDMPGIDVLQPVRCDAAPGQVHFVDWLDPSAQLAGCVATLGPADISFGADTRQLDFSPLQSPSALLRPTGADAHPT